MCYLWDNIKVDMEEDYYLISQLNHGKINRNYFTNASYPWLQYSLAEKQKKKPPSLLYNLPSLLHKGSVDIYLCRSGKIK